MSFFDATTPPLKGKGKGREWNGVVSLCGLVFQKSTINNKMYRVIVGDLSQTSKLWGQKKKHECPFCIHHLACLDLPSTILGKIIQILLPFTVVRLKVAQKTHQNICKTRLSFIKKLQGHLCHLELLQMWTLNSSEQACSVRHQKLRLKQKTKGSTRKHRSNPKWPHVGRGR